MHRQELLNKLQAYKAIDSRDDEVRGRIAAFVERHADCFERSLEVGHVTGSAWIVNQERNRFLLTFHKKLGLWLQLGGHADGNPDILFVALREAREESGIDAIEPISRDIFDVDIHKIPEHKGVPQHFHYDIRFLCQGDDRWPLIVSDESHDLAWFSAADVRKLTAEDSILRMLSKTVAR